VEDAEDMEVEEEWLLTRSLQEPEHFLGLCLILLLKVLLVELGEVRLRFLYKDLLTGALISPIGHMEFRSSIIMDSDIRFV
jgi:hypothetical protein